MADGWRRWRSNAGVAWPTVVPEGLTVCSLRGRYSDRAGGGRHPRPRTPALRSQPPCWRASQRGRAQEALDRHLRHRCFSIGFFTASHYAFCCFGRLFASWSIAGKTTCS